MKAMILAAGRGCRLRPFTNHTPKPLLVIGGEPLIVRQVKRLTKAGFDSILINVHHLGEQIIALLGDGSAFGTKIEYSEESMLLGAAGGIKYGLVSGKLPSIFAVINSDIYCDYDLSQLRFVPEKKAHLVLVDNPAEHLKGDFALQGDCLKTYSPALKTYTYAGMSVFNASFFAALPPHPQACELRPLLEEAITEEQVSASYHSGVWYDVGTPSALARINAWLNTKK